MQNGMQCAACGNRMDLIFASAELRIMHVVWTIHEIPVWFCPECKALCLDFMPSEYVPVRGDEEDQERPERG